jgi:hypothetical protein
MSFLSSNSTGSGILCPGLSVYQYSNFSFLETKMNELFHKDRKKLLADGFLGS